MDKPVKDLGAVTEEELRIEAYRSREKGRRDRISKTAYAKKQGIIKIAKNMVRLRLDISMIEKATELTLEELKEIEKEVKSDRN